MFYKIELNKLAKKLIYYGAVNDQGMSDTPTKKLLREAYIELSRLDREYYQLQQENARLKAKAVSVNQFMQISEEDFLNDRYA